MYRLNFFRKSTKLRLRKHLIETLFFPLLDYCSLVMRDISNELKLKLQRVINSWIRYIFGIRKVNTSLGIESHSTGWQLWAGAITLQAYLCTNCFNLKFLDNSFYVKSSYFWNSLPPMIRHCTTLHSFKKVVFNYLFSLEAQAMPRMRARL